jgi:hypothetical protein
MQPPTEKEPMMMRLAARFLLLLTAASLFPATLLHAGTGSIGVAPAVVMLRGTPGQTTTQTLTVTNATTQALSFEMIAKDVVVRNGKRMFVAAGELPGSIAGSATFSQKLVTVAPGQSARVDMTVTIPPQPASRAIVGFFRGTTRLQSNATTMTASVGTLLTFTFSDGAALTASTLSVTPPTPSANLSMHQKLTNSSTEPVVAQGVLAIVNAAGALVGKVSLPSRRLLPGEENEVTAEYGGDLPPATYRALVTYDFQGKSSTSSADFQVK